MGGFMTFDQLRVGDNISVEIGVPDNFIEGYVASLECEFVSGSNIRSSFRYLVGMLYWNQGRVNRVVFCCDDEDSSVDVIGPNDINKLKHMEVVESEQGA